MCDPCVLLQLRETRTTEMPLWHSTLLDQFINFFFISQPWACGSSSLLRKQAQQKYGKLIWEDFCSVFILSLQTMVKAAAKEIGTVAHHSLMLLKNIQQFQEIRPNTVKVLSMICTAFEVTVLHK